MDVGLPGESESSVTIKATWVMRPAAVDGTQGPASVAGAGVGEVGGAHWFAMQVGCHNVGVDIIDFNNTKWTYYSTAQCDMLTLLLSRIRYVNSHKNREAQPSTVELLHLSP